MHTGKRNPYMSQKGKDEITEEKRSLINLGRFPDGPLRRFPFDEPFHDDSAFVILAAGEYFPMSTYSRRGKLKWLRRRKASGTVHNRCTNEEAFARRKNAGEEREGWLPRFAPIIRTHLFGPSNGWSAGGKKIATAAKIRVTLIFTRVIDASRIRRIRTFAKFTERLTEFLHNGWNFELLTFHVVQ